MKLPVAPLVGPHSATTARITGQKVSIEIQFILAGFIVNKHDFCLAEDGLCSHALQKLRQVALSLEAGSGGADADSTIVYRVYVFRERSQESIGP